MDARIFPPANDDFPIVIVAHRVFDVRVHFLEPGESVAHDHRFTHPKVIGCMGIAPVVRDP